MALKYKLEYLKDDADAQDSGLYIHLRVNVPVYVNKIEKETYDTGSFKHDWMDGIFNIGGVTDASSRAYRVWVSKSPAFQWDEVVPPLLTFMMTYFGETELEEMQGSAITLKAGMDRRRL